MLFLSTAFYLAKIDLCGQLESAAAKALGSEVISTVSADVPVGTDVRRASDAALKTVTGAVCCPAGPHGRRGGGSVGGAERCDWFEQLQHCRVVGLVHGAAEARTRDEPQGRRHEVSHAATRIRGWYVQGVRLVLSRLLSRLLSC